MTHKELMKLAPRSGYVVGEGWQDLSPAQQRWIELAEKATGGSNKAKRIRSALSRLVPVVRKRGPRLTVKTWRENRVSKKAKGLAGQAGQNYDEHGSTRGDYLSTVGRDFVSPATSRRSPYWDSGGAGLALVQVYRKRVYASSCRWRPSTTSTMYLCGRNEAGTFFAHAVAPCSSVKEAVEWIWNGRAGDILYRQGDVAVISGNGGPRMPRQIPAGHQVVGAWIRHETHPPVPVPQAKQRVIVGRRAVARVSDQTRD